MRRPHPYCNPCLLQQAAHTGQTLVEFTLIAALVAVAAATSIGPVKDAIDNQSKIAAKSMSAEGVETTATLHGVTPVPKSFKDGAAWDLKYFADSKKEMERTTKIEGGSNRTPATE